MCTIVPKHSFVLKDITSLKAEKKIIFSGLRKKTYNAVRPEGFLLFFGRGGKKKKETSCFFNESLHVHVCFMIIFVCGFSPILHRALSFTPFESVSFPSQVFRCKTDCAGLSRMLKHRYLKHWWLFLLQYSGMREGKLRDGGRVDCMNPLMTSLRERGNIMYYWLHLQQKCNFNSLLDSSKGKLSFFSLSTNKSDGQN